MHCKYKSKPFAHQKKALEMSWDKEVFAYFMEMGTGKSKVLIDNIAMLYNAGKINGALIVAPKGVYKNWFDSEIPNHIQLTSYQCSITIRSCNSQMLFDMSSIVFFSLYFIRIKTQIEKGSTNKKPVYPMNTLIYY